PCAGSRPPSPTRSITRPASGSVRCRFRSKRFLEISKEDFMAQENAMAAKNVVLAHGGFVDGSGWGAVYKALKKNGYTVTIVQNPTLSLADDVAFTKRAIAGQNGPVILVGH